MRPTLHNPDGRLAGCQRRSGLVRAAALLRTGLLLAASVAALGLAPGGCNRSPGGVVSPSNPDEAPIPQRILFTMDYSKAAYPDCGWTAYPWTPSWRSEHVERGGPAGRDAIEMRQLPHVTGRDYGGQFDWGWHGNVEPPNPPGGAHRYYRWRMAFSTDSNFHGLSMEGQPSNITNKLLIVGQDCGRNRCRFILNYRANGDSGQIGYFRLQIDGGEDLANTGPYDRGRWLNMQVELIASSTPDAADGGYKIWINNDRYSAPTAARTGIVLRPYNWGHVWFGAYTNEGLAAEGSHAYRHTDFIAAETFDNTWNRGLVP